MQTSTKSPLKKQISMSENTEVKTFNPDPAEKMPKAAVLENIVEDYFKKLQGLASCCSALAHGGNDTANAIAPLVGIYFIYNNGPQPMSDNQSSKYLFMYGALFMSFGLFVLGRRCIETIGTSITTVEPSSGFTTSLVAVFVVQVCTVLGMPVSSTHCGVGAVIGIGLIGGWGNVKWSLMKNVALAWVFTLPATAIISYALVKIMIAFEYSM